MKMSIHHKVIYKFSVIPVKISAFFSGRHTEDNHLKIKWKNTEPRTAKTIFCKKLSWEELLYHNI